MGLLKFLGKVLAFLLLVILVVVLPLTLWTYNIQKALLDRATYNQLTNNRSLYSVYLPAAMPGLVTEIGETPDISAEVRHAVHLYGNLSADDWDQLSSLIVSPEWMQEQVSTNVDALFAWIDGPAVKPDFYIDLQELKDKLGSDEGAQAVQVMVESWRVCNQPQADTIRAILDEDDTSPLPACNPATGELRTRLIAELQDSAVTLSEELPDTLPSEDYRQAELSLRQRTQALNSKVILRVAQRVPYLLFVIPAALFLLIEIVTVRSMTGLLRWYGWAFLVGGLLGLLTILPLMVSPLVLWQFFSGRQSDPAMLPLMIGLGSVLNQITNPMLIQSGGLAIIGFAFIAITRLLLPKEVADGE